METTMKTPLTEEDLAAINALARAELTQEQIYTFAVRLCDNEVDRDFERFTRKSLEALAKLFVGKSGIFDHVWSAQGQAARLYKTEVVEEPGQTTSAGDPACWLKGYAYMVRTEANQDLIAEIEGGIKKEISVGCAVNRSTCSICESVAGTAVGRPTRAACASSTWRSRPTPMSGPLWRCLPSGRLGWSRPCACPRNLFKANGSRGPRPSWSWKD